jgi:hypothetical protein
MGNRILLRTLEELVREHITDGFQIPGIHNPDVDKIINRMSNVDLLEHISIALDELFKETS